MKFVLKLKNVFNLMNSRKKNEYGDTPLHLCLRNNSLEASLSLLYQDKSVLFEENFAKETPIHYFIKYHHFIPNVDIPWFLPDRENNTLLIYLFRYIRNAKLIKSVLKNLEYFEWSKRNNLGQTVSMLSVQLLPNELASYVLETFEHNYTLKDIYDRSLVVYIYKKG